LWEILRNSSQAPEKEIMPKDCGRGKTSICEDGDMFSEDAMVGLAAVENPTAMAMDTALNAVISQIEVALSQSDIYHRAIASLQQVTAEAGLDGQILLKAVSLEAIRLTIAAMENLRPSASEESTSENFIDCMADPEDVDPADTVMFEAIATVMQPRRVVKNPMKAIMAKHRAKRQAKIIEELIMTREEILIQLGERIQLEREARKMSIAQLHARTFIPMYHLQALEGGHTAQLPEDVYLRGFLRRIENALTLENGSLVGAMPTEVSSEILPSWAKQSSKAKRKNLGGLDMNPTHLYFTYAALMAGGVCWLSSQTAPKTTLPDLSNYEPRAQLPMPKAPNNNPDSKLSTPKTKLASQKLASQKLTRTAQKLSSLGNTTIKVGIAPPELMP
jgi:cytoskeleton protein RodZ